MSHTYSQNHIHVVFSIAQSNLASVENYIQNQAVHHKKITFEQEFVSFARKTWDQFRSKICIRLMCRAYGAQFLFFPYPDLPVWANSFRASGAGA
jgi:hypothetical protein